MICLRVSIIFWRISPANATRKFHTGITDVIDTEYQCSFKMLIDLIQRKICCVIEETANNCNAY